MGKGMKGQPMEWKDEEAKKRSLANLQPNAAMKHGLRSQNFEVTLTEAELQQIAKTESDILAQLGFSDLYRQDQCREIRYCTHQGTTS